MFPSFSSSCLRTNVSRFGYVAFFLGARVPHSLVSGLFFCSALGLVFPTVSLYAFGARDPRSDIFLSPRPWSSCSPTTLGLLDSFFYFYSALCFDFGARVLQSPHWLWIQLPCLLHGQSFLFYLFTLGSSCLVVQLSLFIRYQRSHFYLNFDAFRGSVQSTNRQTTILLFSVQHASLVTSHRRFSASTCRFAFNLDY